MTNHDAYEAVRRATENAIWNAILGPSWNEVVLTVDISTRDKIFDIAVHELEIIIHNLSWNIKMGNEYECEDKA